MDSKAQSGESALENSSHEKNSAFPLQEFTATSSHIPLNISWKEPSYFFEGNGVKLKYIPAVAANIGAAPDTFIEALHCLFFFHFDEKSKMRQNILEFSGLQNDIGTLNYMCRMKMLDVLSIEQLVLICRVLCLPIRDYIRHLLADTILNFLLSPQNVDSKGTDPPLSCEEFMLPFNCSVMSEIMFHVRESGDAKEIHILPDITLTEETPLTTSKEGQSLFSNKNNNGKIIKSEASLEEEIKIIPDIQVPEQTMTLSSNEHIIANHSNIPKAVYQMCHNFDFRYQKELLKSGITLNLNQEDYLDQVMGDEDTAFRMACAKYIKSCHNHQKQPNETEEQAAARRAQNAERMRQYRQNLRQLETEEQAAQRRAQNALRMKNYRKFKKELEPELAAERRAQNAERMRNYRKVKQELEPDKVSLRRAQNALRMRNYRKNKRIKKSLIIKYSQGHSLMDQSTLQNDDEIQTTFSAASVTFKEAEKDFIESLASLSSSLSSIS